MAGIDHVFLTVKDIARSRPFYTALMPRLGYGATWEWPDGKSLGFLAAEGSLWIKEGNPRYAGDTFSKDRVGLCEVAFRGDSRAHVDEIGAETEAMGGTILDAPREYPEYVPGYYAVFFADPDGLKLEVVHLPF